MKKILIALAALIAAAVALNLFLRPTALVTPATSGLAVNLVPGSVTVQAEYQMELKSEIGGRVVKSELDPGLPVAAGTVLVQLDPTDLELDIERIESEQAATRKSLALGSATRLNLLTARENLENLERMTAAGNYAPAELEKQRRGVRQIEQSLALEEVANEQKLSVFENTLKVKRRQLQKMTITAPFDGVVSQVLARPGDLIGIGSPIAVLIATSRTVEGKISEENFAGVKLGQKAQVRFLGYGDKQFDATVTKILPTAEPTTQRYVVYLDVKIEAEKLIPGLTGEVAVVVGERQAETIIPRRALFGNSVFVVEDGRVRLRTVETGFVSLTSVEVLKGLQAGERVIVENLQRYREGDRVRVKEQAAR
jgi:RND family efflux transporter MFP subunit